MEDLLDLAPQTLVHCPDILSPARYGSCLNSKTGRWVLINRVTPVCAKQSASHNGPPKYSQLATRLRPHGHKLLRPFPELPVDELGSESAHETDRPITRL